ncbi:MAG: hypothetical protein VX663_06090 [Pseudomonadota bacterium]|nr:hypothetical protein [Pseudomonadota bacterium]
MAIRQAMSGIVVAATAALMIGSLQAAHHEGEDGSGMGVHGNGMMGGMGMMGKMMNKMRGGGDTEVTRDEFLERAGERFAMMDANGDGVIDASDREQMHQKMQGCMEMMHGMRMMGDGMGMMGGGMGMMHGGMSGKADE